MPNIQPNEYTLRGYNVKVTFLSSGFQNQPFFTFEDGQQTLNFKGSDVRIIDTEIGKLVSVTLELTADVGSTSYSVLIPSINLGDPATESNFQTLGIKTVHKTPLVPTAGVLETYHVDQLEGTARSVKVPLNAAAGS